MKRNYILLLVLLFAFFSCQESKNYMDQSEFMNEISIDNFKGNSVPFSLFFDSIKNVPLETTETSLIGNVDKVDLFEEWLFVLDSEMTNAVYIFEKSGKFITVINQRGKGPNEYLSASDITIDRARREVVLFDAEGKKLLFFDFFGNLVEIVKLDFWASNVQYIGEDRYLFNLSSKERSHNLLIIDRKGQYIKKMMPFKHATFTEGIEKMFSTLTNYSGGININFPVSNKVYFFNSESEELEARHYINYGNKGSKEEELKKIQSLEKFHELSDNGLRVGNELFLESERYIYMFSAKGEEFVNILYDKEESKWFEADFLDDFTGIPLTYGVAMEKDVLISFIFPSLLITFWQTLPEEEKEKPEYRYIRENIMTMEDDDNPIIRLMYLKNTSSKNEY